MAKKVLIVIDAQNDFCAENGSLTTKEAQNTVPKIVDLIKSKDWDMIICTRDTHTENYLNTKEGKNLPVKHCMKGTDGWEIHYDIRKVLDSLNGYDKEDNWLQVINKFTFGYRWLGDIIYEAMGEDIDVFICGFVTDICVLNNTILLKNYFSEQNITVMKDYCTGTTPEMHQKALDVMKCCQINIE